MPLSAKTRQELKAKAHALKPVILLGNKGLTESVHKEINRALNDHELIKIKIVCEDRDERLAQFNEICKLSAAEPVQLIGKTAIVYRKKLL